MYPNCFVWTYKQIIKVFFVILIFHFKSEILSTYKLANLSWWNQFKCETIFFSRRRVKLTEDELFSIFKSEHFLKVQIYERSGSIKKVISQNSNVYYLNFKISNAAQRCKLFIIFLFFFLILCFFFEI